MPNEGAMAQLSRPYQIGLAAVAVLAAAWLLLLQGGHSSSPSAPSTAQVSPAPTHTVTAAAAPAKAASEGTAGSATGHGSASSLGGLGKAVEKARGAVATSKAQEKQLAERSDQASSVTLSKTTSTPAAAAAPATAAGPTASKTTSVTVTKTANPVRTKSPAPTAANRGNARARQHLVEAQLAQGKIAVILFWDPKGADDRITQKALRSLRGNSSLKIAIDEASAAQVASFGTITRGVQVYGTPTLLFVNKHGRAVTLTGLQPAYAIAQAVREARHA
jgi:hypothetical protein